MGMISIAIPDSCLEDETTKDNKSKKISVIARAAAIFGVRDILVYDDGGSSSDRRLLLAVLRYLDTPPYLRKRLYPRDTTLRYVGVLHPLNTPGHMVPSDPHRIKRGDVREGVVISSRSGRLLDVGTKTPLPYYGRDEVGSRVTIRYLQGYPDMAYTVIPRDDAPIYLGYNTKKRGRLASMLSSWDGKIILTSRRGKIPNIQTLAEYAASTRLLLVFGSTSRGIHDILGTRIKSVQNSRVLNLFPEQHTGTVRLEEAILGSLAILNIGRSLQ